MRTKYERVFLGFVLALAYVLGACGNNHSNDHSNNHSNNHSDNHSKNDAGTISPTGTDGGSEGDEECTRETLKATIDTYYAALAAHDASTLPLASNVKYTENGETVPIGDGLWKTAGALKFKRSALDTETCNSVTESTIAEGSSDIILGLRIKLEENEICEIEAIIVRDTNDYIMVDPAGLASTASDDWETLLAEDKRSTRGQLINIIDKYLNLFPNGACDFSEDCMRTENGSTLAPCLGLGVGCPDPNAETSSTGMTVRLHVIDVGAGIAVGFTLFTGMVVGGPYDDFHMLKVRDGQVVAVHAVLAASDRSGWE